MSRLILLLAAVALGWWWLSSRRKALRSDEAAHKPGAEQAGAHQMVSCARCGVHVPQAEALQDGEGLDYCCEEHRRLGRGPSGGGL